MNSSSGEGRDYRRSFVRLAQVPMTAAAACEYPPMYYIHMEIVVCMKGIPNIPTTEPGIVAARFSFFDNKLCDIEEWGKIFTEQLQ